MIPLLSLLRFRIILVFHGQFNKAWGRALRRIVTPITYRFVDKIVVETYRDLNIANFPQMGKLDGKIEENFGKNGRNLGNLRDSGNS